MIHHLRIVALALGALAFVGTAGSASATSKCAGSKIKAVAKKVCCKLKLEAKEANTGAAKDTVKETACGQKMTASFTKAETKGPDCTTTSDEGDLEVKVDAFVEDVDDELSTSNDPPATPSKCASCKLKAVCKKTKCKLGLRSKFAAKGTPIDPAKDTACETKLGDTFTKCESAADCLASTGDAGAIEAKVDAFVDDVVSALPDSPAPTTTTIETTTTTTTTFPPCGSATAPECDGTCANPGEVCFISGGTCFCLGAPTACQNIGGVCYGDCGTTGACVSDGGGGCVCAP